ncbi:hypothetical protein DFJ73DRAFT_302765 [Zopfochytrium polystomum]|nr:hypothetical protein DFJ73DRAFT_302765 [Zopfochytrium polystomum]
MSRMADDRLHGVQYRPPRPRRRKQAADSVRQQPDPVREQRDNHRRDLLLHALPRVRLVGVQPVVPRPVLLLPLPLPPHQPRPPPHAAAQVARQPRHVHPDQRVHPRRRARDLEDALPQRAQRAAGRRAHEPGRQRVVGDRAEEGGVGVHGGDRGRGCCWGLGGCGRCGRRHGKDREPALLGWLKRRRRRQRADEARRRRGDQGDPVRVGNDVRKHTCEATSEEHNERRQKAKVERGADSDKSVHVGQPVLKVKVVEHVGYERVGRGNDASFIELVWRDADAAVRKRGAIGNLKNVKMGQRTHESTIDLRMKD